MWFVIGAIGVISILWPIVIGLLILLGLEGHEHPSVNAGTQDDLSKMKYFPAPPKPPEGGS